MLFPFLSHFLLFYTLAELLQIIRLDSCDAVSISEYINVKLYNALTAVVLKALHIIEMGRRRLPNKSLALGIRSKRASKRQRSL